MTDTLERAETTTVWVTDAELIRRSGVPARVLAEIGHSQKQSRPAAIR